MDEADFRTALRAYRAKSIYVGFSGGADSCALLLLLKRCACDFDLDLHAVHFDHQLRSESADDARWCGQFCAEHSIPLNLIAINVNSSRLSGEGIEAAARRLRLEQWRKIVPDNAFVALGHHRDDRSENLFLRLCRGSNVSGLCSMRSRQRLGQLRIIRPLLAWTRHDILAFLHANGVGSWREDSSNANDSFLRNFFRNRVLPLIYDKIPAARPGISRSLDVMELDADFIEKYANIKTAQLAKNPSIELDSLLKLHPAIRIRVIRAWLNSQLHYDFIPNARLLARLQSLRHDHSQHTRLIPLSHDLCLAFAKGQLTLYTPSPVPPTPINWKWREKHNICFAGFSLSAKISPPPHEFTDSNHSQASFDPEQLPDTLVVRLWEHGDTITPFGRTSPVKLKKLFTDARIDSNSRHLHPLLCTSDSTIIWACNLRHSNFAPVSPQNHRVTFFLDN